MKYLKICSLVLPLVVLMGFVALHATNKNTGTSWVVNIDGYDPRDLLRGHYLTYRYDWNWDSYPSSCVSQNCCLCLNQVSAYDYLNPVVKLMKCKQAQSAGQCTSMIKGQGRPLNYTPRFRIGGRKGNNLTRYYIPEKHAKTLDRMLRNRESAHKFAIGLRVNDNGHAFIENLYIDKKPLNDWLREYEQIN